MRQCSVQIEQWGAIKAGNRDRICLGWRVGVSEEVVVDNRFALLSYECDRLLLPRLEENGAATG